MLYVFVFGGKVGGVFIGVEEPEMICLVFPFIFCRRPNAPLHRSYVLKSKSPAIFFVYLM